MLPLRKVQHMFLRLGNGEAGACRPAGLQWPPLAWVPVSTGEEQQKCSIACRYLMAAFVLQLVWKAVGAVDASVYPVRPGHQHPDSLDTGCMVQGNGTWLSILALPLTSGVTSPSAPFSPTKHRTSSLLTSLSPFENIY